MRTFCACVVLLLVSAPLSSQSPDVLVTLTTPATVEPGGFTRLLLTVRNTGPTDLVDVALAVSSTSIGAFGIAPDGRSMTVSVLQYLSGLSIAEGLPGVVPPQRRGR